MAIGLTMKWTSIKRYADMIHVINPCDDNNNNNNNNNNHQLAI